MDTAYIQRIKSNLCGLLSRMNGVSYPDAKTNPLENESVEDSVPSSLSALLTFSILKDIGDKKREILTLQSEQDLKPFLQKFNEVEALASEGVKLSDQVAAYLEFLHTSSQILQQALRDPMIQDALPLPYHLHSKAIQTIDDCIWVIQHRGWQPLGYEVDWDNLLLKLQQENTSLLTSIKQSEKYLKQVQDLKLMLELIFKNYSTDKS